MASSLPRVADMYDPSTGSIRIDPERHAVVEFHFRRLNASGGTQAEVTIAVRSRSTGETVTLRFSDVEVTGLPLVDLREVVTISDRRITQWESRKNIQVMMRTEDGWPARLFEAMGVVEE